MSWTVLACHAIKGTQNKAKNKAKRLLDLLGTKYALNLRPQSLEEHPSCAAAEQALPVQLSFASPGLGIPVNEQKTARRLETKTKEHQRT